jgi:hypothetical protein
MSELHLGADLSAASGDIQFTLPAAWQRELQVPWRIFERFDVIKDLFPRFRLPI